VGCVDYLCRRADVESHVAATDLGATFDEHDPEGAVVVECLPDHCQKARLEDMQR
jgi:hypothetical protein